MELFSIPGKKLNILLVDEHENIRKGIRRILAKEHTNFFEASNVPAAIKYFNNNAVDLIIADIYLSGMDGLDLLREIRSSHRSDIPFLVLTGETNKDDIVKAVSLGIDDYLIKPVQPEDLFSKVNSALKKYFNPSPLLKQIREAEQHLIIMNNEKAKSCFEKLITQGHKTSRIFHGLGEANRHLGLINEAIAAFTKSIENNREYFRSYARLGDIYLSQHNEDMALEFIEKELQINPKQFDRLKFAAKLLVKNDKHMIALKYFKQALVINPRDYEIVMEIAKNFTCLNDLNKADQYYRRAMRINPNAFAPIKGIVHNHLQKNDPDRAFLFLKSIPIDKIKVVDMFLIRSHIYFTIGKFEKAQNELEQALIKAKNNKQIIYKLINVLMKRRRYWETISYYNKLIKMDPDDPVVFKRLALVYTKINDPQKAIKMYKKSLALYDNDPDIYMQMSKLYVKTNHLNKAKNILAQSIEIIPDDLELKKSYNKILEKIKKKKSKKKTPSKLKKAS